MNILLCYDRCSTCKDVIKELESRNFDFEIRDIVKENPSASEIEKWSMTSNLPLKKFFNTSGMLYREKGLSKKLPTMTDDEKLELLASDGMLVKRPILLCDDGRVLVGPMVKTYIKEDL